MLWNRPPRGPFLHHRCSQATAAGREVELPYARTVGQTLQPP